MDQQALVRAILRDRAKLTAYLWGIVRDVHATDDVFQEVCVRAIAKRESIKDEGHLFAWARRVGRDLAVDHVRRRSASPLLFDDKLLDMLESDWDEKDKIGAAETTEALRRCIGLLPAAGRELLKMRYVEGLKSGQIAEQLNRRIDTVYKTLTRTHRALMECVTRRLSAQERGA
jgi:RNA polymerase sigma-70 factor (ECF subfamily)